MTKEYPTRTPTQNDCLHRYLRIVSDSLNDAGLDVRSVVEHQMSIPWSETLAKELLWRRAQRKTGKESTTRLNTKEVSEVYEVVNRFLGELGIEHIPFPSKEDFLHEGN